MLFILFSKEQQEMKKCNNGEILSWDQSIIIVLITFWEIANLKISWDPILTLQQISHDLLH